MRRPSPLQLVVVSLFLVVLGQACAWNPVTGSPDVTFVSLEDELEIGEEVRTELPKSIHMIADGELFEYVDGIGKKLAEASPRQEIPYSFGIWDVPEANAVAYPGGPI